MNPIFEKDFHNGESSMVEFKTKFSPQYIAQNISAFANADGGRLYIGINDDGTYTNLSSKLCEQYLSNIQKIIGNIGASASAEIITTNENTAFVFIKIDKSDKVIYSTDGKAYLRLADKIKSANTYEIHSQRNSDGSTIRNVLLSENECCISAITIHSNCKESLLKNLNKEKTTYFLNNRCKEVDGKIVINKKQNVYPDGIHVSAIVGKNGSGKSALLEIMYRIINNFCCLAEVDIRRNASERISFVDGLFADLYYVINNDLLCISCQGQKVELLKNGESLFLIDSQNRLFSKEILLKFSVQNLFYTIVTNYSIQALNPTDFAKEPTYYYTSLGEFKNSPDDVSWLSGLFNKNDGYITPIVLNPYRNRAGNIDVETEFHLTTSRLSSILILYKNNKEEFIDKYQLNKIQYELDINYVVDKFIGDIYPSGQLADTIRNKIWNFNDIILKSTNCYASLILEAFGYKSLIKKTPNNDIETDRACAYLVYKVFSIASKYPGYEKYSGFGNIQNFDDDVDESKRGLLNELVDKIKRDKSHITLKIRQTQKLLDAILSYSNFDWNKYSSCTETTYFAFFNNGTNKTKKNTLPQIMEMLPPPFFKPSIYFDLIENSKVVSVEPIGMNRMSAGERQFIYLFSTYIYHIINILSIQDSKRIKYRNINMVFDEVEMCLHPEYQRLFLNKIFGVLRRLNLTRNCSFNIIVATHSPFVLSDIPQSNILYMKDGKDCSSEIEVNPFGANINDVLQQSFFLENGFMGAFAQEKINSLVDFLSSKVTNTKNWDKERAKDFIENIVGEDIVKDYLNRMFCEKFLG